MFVIVKKKKFYSKTDESFIEVFLCLIGSSHIHFLLVQSCGQLLKVHRLISLTQKCHCTTEPATEHSYDSPITQETQRSTEGKTHLNSYFLLLNVSESVFISYIPVIHNTCGYRTAAPELIS